MKKAIGKLVLIFVLYTLLSVVQRGVFIAIHAHLAGEVSVSEWFGAFVHGLPLDLSIAGYLSVVPSLLIIAALAGAGRWERLAEKIYFGITALFLSAVFVADIVLYSYWGTRLDFTPLFYFSTSPAAAMASATTPELIAGISCWLILSAAVYALFASTAVRFRVNTENKLRDCLIMIPVTGCLFIPIRGSFTVAPVNLSYAYFCDNQRVNHAAINPAFSLFYSLSHQNNFDRQFRFMESDEAEAIHRGLYSAFTTDTLAAPLINEANRPDIYIILLESFTPSLLPSMGGENVASGLDSIARAGLFFSRIYASGFRTDRAIPAVVSGFPAQPTVSVMKYVEKASKLPALPHKLAEAGYESTYYYGGDADFTNMKAYLMNSGFSKIVSDKDFALKERLSKWGAPDHLVFERAFQDISARADSAPQFIMIQTSSSHEPFEVPYSDARFADNKKLNSFAYVDSCAAGFVRKLAASGRADNALIIFIADHYGFWPENAEGLDRFHIPLIMTGGALLRRGEISEIGSQTDIAATILTALGLDSSEFEFSRDLLNHSAPGFALFAGNGSYGYVSDTDTLIYDCSSKRLILSCGKHAAATDSIVKGSLQYLYHQISNL